MRYRVTRATDPNPLRWKWGYDRVLQGMIEYDKSMMGYDRV